MLVHYETSSITNNDPIVQPTIATLQILLNGNTY